MSKLEAQLKQLELKMKKVSFLHHILKSVEEYDEKEWAEVKEEVVGLVQAFVEDTVDSIENGTNPKQGSEVPAWTKITEEDLLVLKKLSEGMKNRKAATKLANDESFTKDSAEPASKPKNDVLGPHEMMNFAMEHRHLSGKKVRAASPEAGTTADGTVVGVVPPFILVQTDKGPKIKVKPENISLI